MDGRFLAAVEMERVTKVRILPRDRAAGERLLGRLVELPWDVAETDLRVDGLAQPELSFAVSARPLGGPVSIAAVAAELLERFDLPPIRP